MRQQSCTPNTGNGGNYYNFGAASAGVKLNAQNDTINSICPASWTIVGYSGDKSYVNLTIIYLGIDKNTLDLNTSFDENLRSTPISFVRSGYYNYGSSTLNARGSDGLYWLSRASNATNAYRLYFYSAGIYLQSNSDKGYGFPLRCVAR